MLLAELKCGLGLKCIPDEYNCSPDDGHVCSPIYCIPDAYNICDPETNENGGCDPHDDNW